MLARQKSESLPKNAPHLHLAAAFVGWPPNRQSIQRKFLPCFLATLGSLYEWVIIVEVPKFPVWLKVQTECVSFPYPTAS